jgi:signal transduction histidine kinase
VINHERNLACYNIIMKRNYDESSLISVFRLFIGARLVFSVFPFVILISPLTPRTSDLNTGNLLSILETAILLGYLSWPWLRHKTGTFYLPVALWIATLGPILENSIPIMLSQPLSPPQDRFLAGQGQLIILLIPFILISWRYEYNVVLTYSLTLAVIDLALILPFESIGDIRFWIIIGQLVFRTLSYLFIGYIVVRLVTDLRNQHELVLQANRKLASYAETRDQLATSRERNRLARELHDTLAHTLSGVAVQLEAVNALWENNPGEAHTMLENSLIATRSGLNEARRAIGSLRASPVEDLGLVIAISSLARSEAERNNLMLDMSLPEKPPEFAPDVEHSIYRITAEALNNIVQHSHASKISVDLRQKSHQWILSIRDNGNGFDYNRLQKNEHFGLRGMKEYADSIRAELIIESHPENGTTISLRIEDSHDQGINL